MLHIKEVPHVAQWLRAYACIGMREGFTNMVGMIEGSYTRDSCGHYFLCVVISLGGYVVSKV